MRPELAGKTGGVHVSADAMRDLELDRLVNSFLPDASEAGADGAFRFLRKYLTCDANEITKRQNIFMALGSVDGSLAQAEKIAEAWKTLARSLCEAENAARPLLAYAHRRNAARSYMQSVQMLAKLFSGKKTGLENDNGHYAEISEYAGAVQSGDFYKLVGECLDAADGCMTPPRNASVAYNVDDKGKVASYGLTGVNNFAKDEAPAGIFGAGRKATGLGEAAMIRQKQSLAGLETFLFEKIEKRYKSPLAKALKIFGKISFEPLRDWLDWLEPIFLYRAGLAFKRGVYGLGLRDCAARPEGESFSAANISHPNSVLAGNAPVPVSLKFNAGDAVFVTGANGSGKTTGLKALAQNAVVAQLGFNVPAEKFCFAPQKS
ncbi:MAG: hypothetical protein FWF03_08265, partial [Defluviitaleaceae bacterium]|nr:hypothetical protein [Defluviitaleaceae bacterium]